MKALLSIAMALALSAPAVGGDFSGAWAGAYDCDEITREFTINLVPSGGNVYSGLVSFLAGESLGQFAVRGATSPDGEIIVVEPSGWIEKPEGYAMVGFKARIHGDILFGTMSNDRCGGVFAKRGGLPMAEGVPPTP